MRKMNTNPIFKNNKGNMAKQAFTIYRTIRIDGQFDTGRHDGVDDAIEAAVSKVLSDAMAHSHTIEEGIEITDIIDCGAAI